MRTVHEKVAVGGSVFSAIIAIIGTGLQQSDLNVPWIGTVLLSVGALGTVLGLIVILWLWFFHSKVRFQNPVYLKRKDSAQAPPI